MSSGAYVRATRRRRPSAFSDAESPTRSVVGSWPTSGAEQGPSRMPFLLLLDRGASGSDGVGTGPGRRAPPEPTRLCRPPTCQPLRASPGYREQIGVQLTKGESPHDLRRFVLFANQGE